MSRATEPFKKTTRHGQLVKPKDGGFDRRVFIERWPSFVK